ncbi:MAG: hypothetical protein J0M02_11860 [Planctomycetes bacterium]|nr:hypothetical protein [Planctomycetota bacterium]
MTLSRVILGSMLACALHALQLQDVELASPVTGERFNVVVIGGQPGAVGGESDMGTDIDGCRHSSGPCEYDYYVVVDPYSYFAALSSEWDMRTGRFQAELPQPVVAWVRKEWGSEREIDLNHSFQYALQTARSTGRQPPDRKTFRIPQDAVSIDKRYRLALTAYERRGARHAVLAKIALTGAWALRVRAQVPVAHPSLAAGFEEVNGRISRQLKDGEAFDLDKWSKIYSGMVEKDGLTREGYTIAASTSFGFLLRQGELQKCRDLMTAAGERLGKDDKPDALRGLLRDRKRLFEEHNKLLQSAVSEFTAALGSEEIVRSRIPEVLLVVAESYRRLGIYDRAGDWYLALSRLPETQPAARAALRFEGKMRALPADKPYHVQLGWIADEQREKVDRIAMAHSGELSGPDRGLLTAIINEGLGTAAYNAPGWKPMSGATQADSALVLDLVGKGVIEYAFRLGGWPKTLGELWETEVVKDRNRVNRFNCPATGKPLLYTVPPGDLSSIAPSTVLVATSTPVETVDGPRFGAFCANTKLVWLAQAPVLGQPLPKP